MFGDSTQNAVSCTSRYLVTIENDDDLRFYKFETYMFTEPLVTLKTLTVYGEKVEFAN